MGRTGKWCAYQHFDILPDITTLAKPLAGGIPMGAMLCTEEAARAITPGMHGTTFGGNPFACAVAIAVIDDIKQDNLLAHVNEVGDYFIAQLRTLASNTTTPSPKSAAPASCSASTSTPPTSPSRSTKA